MKPILAQLLHQPAQIPRRPVELALSEQLGKQRQVVGANIANILGFAGRGDETLHQHECEFRLGAWFALEIVLAWRLIPGSY